MDPVTQGVVGAALAQACARKEDVRLATLAGVAGGMAADLDIFIRSTEDPLLTIEYHRHFTHALAFIPIGGLLVAAVLWPLVRRRAGFFRWLWFATLGYATAGVLDACTSYGTRLFWPFWDARIAWDLIAVIDPFFTLPLLVLAAVAAIRRRPGLARVACVFGLLYLGAALLQRERAASEARDLAANRGHDIARLVVKPSMGNLLVWRSTYIAGSKVWVDAIRVGVETRVYPGESALLVVPDRAFPDIPDPSVLRTDIGRFAEFSDQWLCWHPDRPSGTMLADVRYASLPDEISPLWGIEVDRAQPDRHAPFVTTRRLDDATWARFWAMLRGAAAPQRAR